MRNMPNKHLKKYMNSFAGSSVFRVLILTVLISVITSCSPWRNATKRNMTVVFYNVENLFDTTDAPEKADEEFTPDSEKNWNTERYEKKLEDLARVISAINEGDLPEIVGLSEVENVDVLNDLTRTGFLAKGKYKAVHHESPDFRVIDCALIYRPAEFKVLDHSAISIKFEDEPDYKTRDILYVKGRTRNWEQFHIFVNHWPSRIGGVEQTSAKRKKVASVLKSKIDSVLEAKPKARIVVMGDMNDEPTNESLLEVLNARPPSDQSAELGNLMFPEDEEGRGTYNFRGNWNMLDNIIVSSNLLDDKGFEVMGSQGFIFHQDWMEFTNRQGVMYPNRTYGGPNYYGGVSDHFPVYIRLMR
jgi:predicted extracellular nuclease